MNKKLIRLTESDIKEMVLETLDSIGNFYQEGTKKFAEDEKSLEKEYINFKRIIESNDEALDELNLADIVDEYTFDYLKDISSVVYYAAVMDRESISKRLYEFLFRTKELEHILSMKEDNCQVIIPQELMKSVGQEYNIVEWLKIRCGFIIEIIEKVLTELE